VVVCVWRSAWTAIAAVPYAILPQDTVDEVDGAAADAALALAREGAALIPGASVHCMRTTAAVWQAILEYADEVDAELIVAGSRGLSLIESTVLGSVSHGLVNHSRRPVLVVPPTTG
jgi:nucleotide-binding universal stress UspA family protein